MYFEIGKLIIQFLGALLIARLAVRWALSRYQTEKMWERRLSAYSDVMAAVGDMKRLNRLWFEDAVTQKDRPEDVREAQGERFKKARRRLNETIATANLLLPKPTQDTLAELDRALSHMPETGYLDALDQHYSAIQSALKALTAQGRSALKLKD